MGVLMNKKIKRLLPAEINRNVSKKEGLLD
jgi:hypothetical protein